MGSFWKIFITRLLPWRTRRWCRKSSKTSWRLLCKNIFLAIFNSFSPNYQEFLGCFIKQRGTKQFSLIFVYYIFYSYCLRFLEFPNPYSLSIFVSLFISLCEEIFFFFLFFALLKNYWHYCCFLYFFISVFFFLIKIFMKKFFFPNKKILIEKQRGERPFPQQFFPSPG